MKNWVISVAAFTLVLVPIVGAAGPDEGARPTLVEISPPLPAPEPGVLSTVGYSPTEKEKPFLEKVTEKAPDNYIFLPKSAEKTIYSTEEVGYSLTAADGKYVGWFGIVRKISRDSPAGQTRLLIEHKYFDGLTDLHLQVVSFFGAGDFIALLAGNGFDIPLLGLVAIYGAMKTGADGMPQVTADYIRVWNWGRFTFMPYGEDKSNPQWIKLRRVKGDDAYSSRPTKWFYVERLGALTVPGKTAPAGSDSGKKPKEQGHTPNTKYGKWGWKGKEQEGTGAHPKEGIGSHLK